MMPKSRPKRKQVTTQSVGEIETPRTPLTTPSSVPVNKDAQHRTQIESEELKKDTISHASIDTGTTGSTTDVGSMKDHPTTYWQLLVQGKPLLLLCMIISVILGYIIGFYLKHTRPQHYWTERRRSYVGFPGELFFNILSSIRDPVIFTSMVAAVGSTNKKICRFIPISGCIIAGLMNIIAATIGVLFTIPLAYNMPNDPHPPKTICPISVNNGSCIDQGIISADGPDFRCVLQLDVILDLLSSHLPRNLVETYLRQSIRIPNLLSSMDPSLQPYTSCAEFLVNHSTTNLEDLKKYDVSHLPFDDTNITGILFTSIVIGVCVIYVGEAAQPFMNLFISFSEIFLKMASWALYLAPVGMLFHTIKQVLANESLPSLAPSIQWFLVTANLALLFYSFVALPAIYWIFIRKSPLGFYSSIAPTITSAFSISASSSTIPFSITGLEEVAHLDPRVVRYLIPIMAIVNFSGNSLYVASSIVYLTFKHSVPLNFLDFLSIILIASLIPLLVPRSTNYLVFVPATIVVALDYLNLDTNMVFDIITSYWIVDACATLANVLSDCVVTALVNRLSRHSLKALTLEDEKKMAKAEVAGVNQQWDELYEQTTETITAAELPGKFIFSD